MIRYKSTRQMSIDEFRTPFQVRLDKENRWVKLGSSLPWDALASIYYRYMSSDQGAPSFDAMTTQIILTSEGKHEAARKDLNDFNDVNANKADKMIASPTDLALLTKSRQESNLRGYGIL